ncbi:hypothetical protein DAEQUDRAFT_165101 [Daedalea quercina L-15889]|uniref:Uncharacterized protein n=1 Tax=Daedalea quercina L-15889 TaxID=1314783 RepID=A0A165RHP9_9APHY|nr:hypothetical protein DAEQUDRAFT_165101 [Daedalea quercina L-15889]
MAPPRKPLTTYSRRSRARAASKADDQASSPLQPLPTDMEDVTMTEMARRMQKRSRQSSSIVESGQQIEEGSQKAKKAKNDTAGISEAVQPSPVPYWISSTLSERMTGQLPIQPSQMPETLFCTPCPSFCSEKAMLPSSTAQSVCPEQGDFSPLPAARHMLSRTSSRHLKENCLRALGSPFDSRPPSRITSPSTAQMKEKRKGKGKAQRSPPYAKSRTFSVPADPMTMDVGEQGLLVHGERKYETKYASATQVGQPRTSLNSHHRTGSIPTVSSIQITHNWLAHPAALSKASGLNASPTHSSFFLDVPNGASTPPRKRRATTGMRIETQDYDITLSDMSMSSSTSSGAYTQAESHQSSPESDGVPRRPPLRMRRRTITDPSGGSLFSSVLDFSGSAAEEQRASVALDVQGADSHRRTTSDRSHREDHAPLATAFSALNVGLASAFTPGVDTLQTTHGHVLHRSASLPALNVSPQPSCAPGMTSYDLPGDLGGLDSSDTQLRDLFTTLQLGGR